MTGEQLITASQQEVWDALNDPDVLKACIPGCEAIEKTSDTGFSMLMTAAVGPVRAKFKGTLTLGELDPPKHYVLSFEGTGGAAGFGKGSASVSLAADGDGTRLGYVAKAQVGGKLAQVGSRLIDGVARKMAEDFFSRFNARFASEPARAPAPAIASSEPTAARDAANRSATSAGFTSTAKAALVAIATALILYIAWSATR